MVCASKDVTSSADNSIAADKNQYEIVPDNIAAESIDISTKLKRGASTNDSQNQSSQGEFPFSFSIIKTFINHKIYVQKVRLRAEQCVRA